jgi:hypothetical protein
MARQFNLFGTVSRFTHYRLRDGCRTEADRLYQPVVKIPRQRRVGLESLTQLDGKRRLGYRIGHGMKKS